MSSDSYSSPLLGNIRSKFDNLKNSASSKFSSMSNSATSYWQKNKSWLTWVLVAVAVVAAGLFIWLIVWSVSKKSSFDVSYDLNWGAYPHIDFAKDNNSEDRYKWVEVEKPNLDTLVPEYNFKTGVVDYRFGEEVYDSDTASVNDVPLNLLSKSSNKVAVVNNLPPPPAVTQVLVPITSTPPTIVSPDSNVAMVPVGAPQEQVVLELPAEKVNAPPVLVPTN